MKRETIEGIDDKKESDVYAEFEKVSCKVEVENKD